MRVAGRQPYGGGATRLRTWPRRERGFLYASDRALIPNMDPNLENVIRQALADAQAAGRDDMGQTVLAVQTVQQARPDMTAADALAAVNLVRRK